MNSGFERGVPKLESLKLELAPSEQPTITATAISEIRAVMRTQVGNDAAGSWR